MLRFPDDREPAVFTGLVRTDIDRHSAPAADFRAASTGRGDSIRRADRPPIESDHVVESIASPHAATVLGSHGDLCVGTSSGAGVSPSRAADDDGQVLASRPVQPGAAASEQRVRHFVAVVVGIDSLTFQGQRTTLDELPAMLERVPDREHTVLELAYSDGDVTIRQFNEVQFQLMELVTKLGFEYLSMTGEHPASYQGKPDRMVDVPATQPDRILPALTPAPVSQLTHQLDFHFGQVQFAPGDTINITEVRGTSDNMMVDGTYQVKGTYTLASHDHATLAVSVSAKDPKDARGYWCADQTIRITKGSGTFTLTERLACEGYPHISFYGDNGAIGGVYFGTGSWIWQ